MADDDNGIRNLPVEVRTAIRKEAIDQTAKWFIAAFVGVFVLAAAGWWLLFEPKLKSYIAEAAGGVPAEAIIASTQECSKLPNKWTAFKEGTGRFIVGAGTETTGLYSSWSINGSPKKKLSSYEVMTPGGEENHSIQSNEVPTIVPAYRRDLGAGDQGAVVGIAYGKDPNQKPIDIIPPYIALYLCKKQ